MNARRSIAPSAASSGTASAKPKAFDLYGMTEDEIKGEPFFSQVPFSPSTFSKPSFCHSQFRAGTLSCRVASQKAVVT